MQPIQRTDAMSVMDVDDAEQIEMSIDTSSLTFLMTVLSDLYSDREMAVLRELSTNAWDSHVEAGVTRPIEVTLPSRRGFGTRFLKIKDFGLGMNVEDLRNVYSMYGASTKRGSNDFNGMLGLGSKSPLAYTNHFTVTGIKNGIRTEVAVTKNEQGVGVMTVMDEDITDEPNGVEIVIPVKDSYNDFDSKAEALFRFWEPGRVLVNGVEPKRLDENKITDRISLVKGLENDYIVMGGVAYRVNSDYALAESPPGRFGGFGYRNYGVVARVNIGEVEFTPSREDLNYTGHTKAALISLREEFKNALNAYVEKDITTADSHAEAIERYFGWTATLQVSKFDVKYKGLEIPEQFEQKGLGIFTIGSRGGIYTRHSVNTGEVFTSRYGRGYAFVYGWEQTDLTPTLKRKINHYFGGKTQNGHAVRELVFTKDKIGAPWTDGHEHVSYETIKAVKLPKAAPSAKVQRQKYDVLDTSGRTVNTDDCQRKDASGNVLPIVYYSPAEYDYFAGSTLVPLLDQISIVVIGKNRWDKFKRDWPGAIHISEWMNNKAKTAASALTEDDIKQYNMDSRTKSLLTSLEPYGIVDPEVVEAIRIAKLSDESDTLNKYRATKGIASRMGINVQAIPERTFLDKYPLVRSATYYSLNYSHAALYMNAVHQAGI